MSYAPHDAIVVNPGQDLAAVVAALPSGSKVYLGDGTHVLASDLVISGKTDISIEGSPAALISDARGGAGFSIDLLNSSRVTLRGFRLTTNRTTEGIRMGGVTDVRCLDLTVISNAAGSTVNGAFGLTNGSCSDVLIQGCHVSGNFENTVRMSSGSGATRVKVIDCHLDSGKGTGISNVDITGGGTYSHILLSGCTILGGDRGIYMTNALYIQIEGCIIKSSRSDAVYIGTGCSHIDVIASILDDPGSDGVESVTGTTDTKVGGCVFYSTAGCGVLSFASRSIVDGCVIDDPTDRGIRFEVGTNFIANACVIYSSATDGIDVRTPSQSIVNACVVLETTFNGISTTGAVTHLTVSNCIFYVNTNERMIEINTGASDVTIAGNIVYDAGERSIYVNASTRVSVDGNISDQPNHHHVSLEGTCTFCEISNNICWQNTAAQPNINIGPGSAIQVRANIVNRNFNNSQLIVRMNGATTFNILIEAVLAQTGNQGRFCNPDGSSTGQITIAGCICVGSGVGTSSFATSSTTVADFRMIECLAVDSQNYGVTCNAARPHVVGNMVVHTGVPANFGIRIENTTPNQGLVACNLIRGMTGGIKVEGGINAWNVKGNSIFASTGDGIWLNNGDEGNVCGNRVVGSVGDGIQEDATCDQDMYTENHLRGNGVAENYLGTNRTAADNKV